MTPGRRTPAPLSATEAREPGLLGGHDDAAGQPGSLWVKITGGAAGTNRYAWTQVDEGDTAAFDAGLADGFAATGTSAADGAPAYEINGRTDVATGTRVRLWPAGDLTYYLFAAPATASASSGITVQEADGAPSLAGTTTLQSDQANGLVVTGPAANTAKLAVSLARSSRLMTGGDHIFSAAGNWDDVSDGSTLDLSLAAGTYLLTGTILGELTGNFSDLTVLHARLRNVTDGATVPGTFVYYDMLSGEGTAGDALRITLSFATLYTVAGAKTVRLQAGCNGFAGVAGKVLGSFTIGLSAETSTGIHAVKVA